MKKERLNVDQSRIDFDLLIEQALSLCENYKYSEFKALIKFLQTFVKTEEKFVFDTEKQDRARRAERPDDEVLAMAGVILAKFNLLFVRSGFSLWDGFEKRDLSMLQLAVVLFKENQFPLIRDTYELYCD